MLGLGGLRHHHLGFRRFLLGLFFVFRNNLGFYLFDFFGVVVPMPAFSMSFVPAFCSKSRHGNRKRHYG